MSKEKLRETKKQIMSSFTSMVLVTVPSVVALAEVRSNADFSLFSKVGATGSARLSVQERARKQLMRAQYTTSTHADQEDTVTTETPTTMIAQREVATEADEDDFFSTMLAAPTH